MEEYVDIIDENGNETGLVKLRNEAHRDGDWHKAVHLWIALDEKVILQKRAPDKIFYPNKLEISSTGHVDAGETYKQAAIRETEEELGLSVDIKDLIFLEKRKITSHAATRNWINREIIGVFFLKFNGSMDDINFNKNEISEVRLFDIDELKELLANNRDMFAGPKNDKNYWLGTLDRIKQLL